MDRLCIIGHFGGGNDFFDGQTVKTKILYSELKARLACRIMCVDTYYKAKSPLRLLFRSLFSIISCNRIIILPSTNGRRFFFPLLYFFSIVFKKRVYHIVTGGFITEQLDEYPKWIKHQNSFEVNWIQFQSAANILHGAGLSNVEVLQNFKNLKIVDPDEVPKYSSAPFRFCTFSRISREKGIPDAITAIININRKHGYELATLDIYGQPDVDYANEFEETMQAVPDSIKYKGTVPYDQSTAVLKDYFALLFPTYFRGEGFAGTIIDAFASGLPVIATDWHANAEIIDNNVTGIIYHDNSLLENTVLFSIEHPDVIQSMRNRCLQQARDYMPEQHIDRILKKMQLL